MGPGGFGASPAPPTRDPLARIALQPRPGAPPSPLPAGDALQRRSCPSLASGQVPLPRVLSYLASNASRPLRLPRFARCGAPFAFARRQLIGGGGRTLFLRCSGNSPPGVLCAPTPPPPLASLGSRALLFNPQIPGENPAQPHSLGRSSLRLSPPQGSCALSGCTAARRPGRFPIALEH